MDGGMAPVFVISTVLRMLESVRVHLYNLRQIRGCGTRDYYKACRACEINSLSSGKGNATGMDKQ